MFHRGLVKIGLFVNGDFFAVAVETGVRRKRQHFEDMVDRHVEVERSGELDVFERLAAEGDADAVEILDHPGRSAPGRRGGTCAAARPAPPPR